MPHQPMKRTRVIYCPGPERWVSIKQYIQAVKRAKAKPKAVFKQGLACWWPCTGKEVIRQFRRGIDSRINEAIPYITRGFPK